MPTSYTPKKIYDIKRWETLPRGLPSGQGSGGLVHCRSLQQWVMHAQSWILVYLYSVEEDAYLTLPATGSSTFTGSGTTICATPWSTGSTIGVASLTATAGTTSTITTNQTLRMGLSGWKIQIMAGPNAGATLDIVSNTTGANSVITVPTQASAFSASTQYRLLTPRWYYWIATSSGRDFRVYDYATATWTVLSTTNTPTTFGTDAQMTATPSWIDTDYVSFATGTATSATSTTLVNSGKSWTTSQWVNYQIRITGGTGAGQIRTITANDATSVTVAAWTTTPDNTSTYSIEGNDDFLYLIGNNAVTMYRYQISTNTWTTPSPAVARAAAPASGASLNWVSQSTNSTWTNESSIINGRRLYSFRGGANTGTLDYYDIPSNSWINSVTIAPLSSDTTNESLVGGSRYVLLGDNIYFSPGQTSLFWNRLDLTTNTIYPWASVPQRGTLSSSGTGVQAFPAFFRDGSTTITYIYAHQSAGIMRCRIQ